MIPTMLVVGLVLGFLPRWWPNSLAVTAALSVLVSLAFGLLIGEPVGGGAIALANTAIGVAIGRAAQLVILHPPQRRAG